VEWTTGMHVPIFMAKDPHPISFGLAEVAEGPFKIIRFRPMARTIKTPGAMVSPG